jgi:hypothetical protein
MHNHIAVRLMSFVLEHRPHTRYGHQAMVFRREFEFEEQMYLMEFDEGGYNFVLDEPLPVEVVIGRVRGQVKEPIEHPMPRFDKEVGAYVMPDGSWVTVDQLGMMTPRIKPFEFDAPLDGPELDPTLQQPTVDAPATVPGEPLPASEPSASGEPSGAATPTTAPAAIPINTAVVPVAATTASP